MAKVRTVMQPGVVIDVPDEEAAVLASMGLLADEPAPEKPTAGATTVPAAAVQPAAAKPDPAPPADTTADITAGADSTKKKG